MKRIVLILVLGALAGLLMSGQAEVVRGQGVQPPSIHFRNETPIPVIVQGMSVVGGTLRKGQPILIAAGKNAWDYNVPPGVRQYKIYDASQPSKVLNPSVTIKVNGRDQFFIIAPTKGGQVEIIPDLRPKF